MEVVGVNIVLRGKTKGIKGIKGIKETKGRVTKKENNALQ